MLAKTPATKTWLPPLPPLAAILSVTVTFPVVFKMMVPPPPAPPGASPPASCPKPALPGLISTPLAP